MILRDVAWTVVKQGDAYQARALTRATVSTVLGPERTIAAHGDEPAYRLAEADGAVSGLPFVSSFLPWSRPVATVTKAAIAAANPQTPPHPGTGVTYQASYGSSVIETPPAPPAEMTTSPFSYSPTFGKQ